MANASSNSDFLEKLTVGDGSANQFLFVRRANGALAFEYDPVQPRDSCTSTYSGGTPVFKHLDAGEWTKVMTIYEEAKDRGKPGEYRKKGGLIFSYQSGDVEESIIIEPHTKFNKKSMDFLSTYRE